MKKSPRLKAVSGSLNLHVRYPKSSSKIPKKYQKLEAVGTHKVKAFRLRRFFGGSSSTDGIGSSIVKKIRVYESYRQDTCVACYDDVVLPASPFFEIRGALWKSCMFRNTFRLPECAILFYPQGGTLPVITGVK